MSIALNDEQADIASVVRSFCEQRSPEGEVRRLMESESGFDERVWRQMATELDLQALVIPPEYGGVGYTQVELGVVFEELGRALLCTPYFATIALAANTLLAVGDAQANERWLPSIASGATIATLVAPLGSADRAGGSTAIDASPTVGGWQLDGVGALVIDGLAAELLLVVAGCDHGIGLFVVEGDAPGLTREPLETLDWTRRVARLTFTGTPALPIGDPDDCPAALERALDLATVALAAEQVGGAQHMLDMTVQYAKDRVQFGRPIGSFQAVKHTCADLLVDVESSRAAAYHALAAAANEPEELPLAASIAKAFCSDAYVEVAEDALQLHGGIGFTWEHPTHLYLKRAKSSQLILGTPADHRRRIAALLDARDLAGAAVG